MAGTLKLAWRNLGRNRRRTLITGLALTVGTSLCVGTYGLMDGLNAEILHAFTRLNLGHIQLHQPEFPQNRDLEKTLPAELPVKRAAAALEQVQGVAPRVYGYALASHKAKSAGVELLGIDPAAESSVTELARHIEKGRFVPPEPTPWPTGNELSRQQQAQDEALTARAEAEALAEIEALGGGDPEEAATPATALTDEELRTRTRALAAQLDPPPRRPPRVVIGRDLARILKVELGGSVFLISQTVDGQSAEVTVEVAGILHTGTSLYDRGRLYLHVADLQRLLHLQGRVHEFALAVQTPGRAAEQVPPLRAALERLRGDGDPAGAPLVRAWDEIRPDIKNMLALNQASAGLMVFIIFVVAALGVVNTMLMAVFERTRELGMLKAIGMSGGQIVWLIVTETTLLVLVFALLGTGLGLGLDLYMVHQGVDLSSITGGISFGGVGVNPVIHGRITVEGLVMPVTILGLMCFAAAFYPAARAARMRPAQGMREV